MPTLNLNDAVGLALAEEMRHDHKVIAFGEGIATTRHELVTEFGALRVRNTPLAEGIIAGTAAGSAACGLRPGQALTPVLLARLADLADGFFIGNSLRGLIPARLVDATATG